MPIAIKINDVLVHTITDDELTILKDRYPSGTAGSEITARIITAVNQEINVIRNALINEWFPIKLAENGISLVSTDKNELIQTIFEQTDTELAHVYKDRDARLAELT